MKYGFLGCGNMGGAIARALSGDTTDIYLTDRSGKAEELARQLGCVYGSADVIARCDRIFLAVKPHMMEAALAPLRPVLEQRKPLLITMAAGLTMARIEEMAGTRLPVIRIMPNTPVAVGMGMTQYCANDLVDEETLSDFLADMRLTGRMDYLEEKLFDAATAKTVSVTDFLLCVGAALVSGRK
jgi:pyrroline-5-carboxylate reductase